MAKKTIAKKQANKTMIATMLVIITAAAALGTYVYLNEPKEITVITPVNETNGTATEPAEIMCDYDGSCDAGENANDCPHDCISSTGLSAVRSEESNTTDTTPTVTITMQDPEGIASCGTSETDSLQWDCAVENPGAVITNVSCTLENYGLDGKYMLILRCKDMDNNDVTPVMVDDIIICADELGCKR
jgi:hypothetical protein